MSIPRYARIKQALQHSIESGELRPGDRVPSENQLVEEYGVSRMTARRALRELADTGLLQRTQGLGSFVADVRPLSAINQIRNIADEIHARGHSHRCELRQLQRDRASHHQALRLGLEEGAEVFRCVLLHFENGAAVQREERLVNPEMAPDFMAQDFANTTPSAYLSFIAPLTEAEQSVEAVLPDARAAAELGIAPSQPCLRIIRRTFSRQGVVSLATLLHPGDRYRLGSHIENPSHEVN